MLATNVVQLQAGFRNRVSTTVESVQQWITELACWHVRNYFTEDTRVLAVRRRVEINLHADR